MKPYKRMFAPIPDDKGIHIQVHRSKEGQICVQKCAFLDYVAGKKTDNEF